jgi:signal transduction histidine kinase
VGSSLPRRSRPYRAAGPARYGQAPPAAMLPAAPDAAMAGRGADAALITVAAAGLLTGAAVAWIISHRGPDRPVVPDLPFAVPVAVLVGWSFIASGLLYRRSRPDNYLGPVMIFQGFAWFASLLPDSYNPVLFTLGEALFAFQYASGLYLVLSFPSGRLQGRLDRALMVIAVGFATVVNWTWLLFADPHRMLCRTCTANLLEVTRNDAVVIGVNYAIRVTGIAVGLTGIGLLARRWIRASRPQRHAVMPVAVAGAVAFAAIIAAYVARVAGMGSPNVFDAFAYYSSAAVPVAVLAVIIQRRLAHGAVAGLVIQLGGPGPAADPQEALARALGDPSLELGYWFAAESRYVGRDGRPVELPGLDSGRRSTVVERDGRPVALLIHDRALEHNAKLVQSACAAAGLALENERLAAALRARLVELQASRARLVEATDTERRRIERDLHDGTQQRLVSIAMSLGLADAKLPAHGAQAKPIVAETREALAATLAELRDLTHGIHPAVLTERGLPAALDELCRRSAITAHPRLFLDGRLPAAVETAAYYVVSEALTNAAKHSGASQVWVAATREDGQLIVEVADDGAGGAGTGKGSGLRGLADRVEALDGRLSVVSPPGQGTTLRAEFPCG